jgi:hypothetical protein
MANTKKRKDGAECRSFQEKWTNDYFFVEVKGKPVCLVCGDALALMKNTMECHYSSNTLNSMNWEAKCVWIKSMLFSGVWNHKPLSLGLVVTDNVIQTSYVVSELIAKKLRPHVEGEFVKECMVAAAEMLEPDKVLFQSVSVSRRTVSDRITDLAQDIEKHTKGFCRRFPIFLSGL